MDDEFIKILYVEDNKIDQLAFMQEIEKKELLYDVNIASSLSEALNSLHGNDGSDTDISLEIADLFGKKKKKKKGKKKNVV